jgi:hypothetical protein
MVNHQLSKSGPLGFRGSLPGVLLGPPVTGRQPLQLVSWQAPDEIPRTVNVTISVFKTDTGSNIRHRIKGTVRWGHEGASFAADIDLVQGTSFALLCSRVDVLCQDESDGVVFGATATPVNAMVAPSAPLSYPLPPRRSFVSDGATAIPIPPFAATVDVLGDGAYTIQFLRDGAVVIATVTVAAATMLVRPVPIPNDAIAVVVNVAGKEVAFELAI